MEKSNEIANLLAPIRQAHGEGFQCNEAAIEKEAARHDAQFSNIGIKALSVIGGFAAGLFFLGFLFLAQIIDSEESMLVFGFLFVAVAIAGSRLVDHIILDAATVCLFIIGCVLLAFGTDNPNAASCVLAVIALITLAVTNNYVLAFISVLLFNGSLAALFFVNDAGQWIHLLAIYLTVALTGVCSAEAKIISISPMVNRLFKPVVAGLFVSLAVCLATVILLPEWGGVGVGYVWILWICIWANIMLLIRQILRTFGSLAAKNSLVFYLLPTLVLLPTWYAPSVAGAILMILLSFRFAYKPAFVMSVALLLWFLIQYYYNLNMTLLAKSGILLLSGLLFLAFWLVYHKTTKDNGTI